MDKDRVGLFAGAFFGLIVLAACLFGTHADPFEIAFRAGATFVVAYLAVFFLVHVFQQVAGPELTPKRSVRPLGPMGMDEAPAPTDTAGDLQE